MLVPLRSSNEHILIVRVLRARRMVWDDPLPLLRPRVARAQKIIRLYPLNHPIRQQTLPKMSVPRYPAPTVPEAMIVREDIAA